MKRISKVLIILTIVFALTSLASCSVNIDKEEGLNHLNECIETTRNAKNYYLKSVFIDSSNDSREVQVNVFEDAIKVTFVNSTMTNTTYDNIFYGDALRAGVKKKKATENDYMRGVMISPNKSDDETEVKANPYIFSKMSRDEFINDPKIKDYMLDAFMDKMDTFIASNIEPSKITKNNKVTTYYYDDIGRDNAILFGSIAKDDVVKERDKFPLIIETTYDMISKVSDKMDGIGEGSGKIRYYLTPQGPNIILPNWS